MTKLNIHILVPENHPVIPSLEYAMALYGGKHDVRFIHGVESLTDKADLLFMICWPEIVKGDVRDRYKHALVVHASDLPDGKGWSPLVWQILEGKHDIPITLFEAVDAVDAGDIWKKDVMHFEGHELYEEINGECYKKTGELMAFAIDNFTSIKPQKQQQKTDTVYYERRRPEDSVIDPSKTIAEQFDLLRVCDYDRYPAYFEHRGQKYKIKIEKA